MPATFGSPSTGLPPKLLVPPTTPHLHRRLLLRVLRDGIAIDPIIKDGGEGLFYDWKASGRARKREVASSGATALALAGILGVMTLWDGMCFAHSPLISSLIPLCHLA